MPIPLGEWSGSDATDRLRETIVELNKTTASQTTWLIRMTAALLALTVVIAVLTVVLVVKA